jgi:hypothetical protein
MREDTAERAGFSLVGSVAAFAGAGGLAGCITLLYRGMAVIMSTEGGFVATGGPYEIAHPAPDWAWLVPLSIMAGLAFGGLSLMASFRGWGVNPALFAWMGLFISLGWNFLRLGLIDPPENLESGWGWVISGVVFWLMGFAPAVMLVRVVRETWQQVLGRQTEPVRRTWATPTGTTTTPVYVAAQLLGVAVGIAGALMLFDAVAQGY